MNDDADFELEINLKRLGMRGEIVGLLRAKQMAVAHLAAIDKQINQAELALESFGKGSSPPPTPLPNGPADE